MRGQASLQGLYDPDRFSGPLLRRTTNAAAGQSVLEPVAWTEAQGLLAERLEAAQAGRIAVVTPLLTGTLDQLVQRWCSAVDARRVRYEPFAHEALLAASAAAFGRRAMPRFDFAAPELIVSLGADFLETWLSPVEHGRAFAAGRRRGGGRRMRLVQLEPRLSLTGAQADEWLALEPGTEGLVAAAMVHVIVAEGRALLPEADGRAAERIFGLVRNYPPESVAARAGLPAETIRTLARRFADPAAGGGRTLAVGGGVSASGHAATAALTAIHLLNHVAGNTGVTVTFDAEDDAGAADPAGWDSAGTHRDMQELATDMAAGRVDLLLLHDVNPVHAMPGGARFAAAMARVPTVVSTASCPDETASHAHLILPTHTPLEAWGRRRAAARRARVAATRHAARCTTREHLGDLLLDRRAGAGCGDRRGAARRGRLRRAAACAVAGSLAAGTGGQRRRRGSGRHRFRRLVERRAAPRRRLARDTGGGNAVEPGAAGYAAGARSGAGRGSARWRWWSTPPPTCTTAAAPTAPGSRKSPTR